MMSQINVLVIEDNPIHQAYMQVCLEQMGYTCSGVADNATEGLELFCSAQPDVLIVDIELAGEKSGIDFVQQVREIRSIPVIFATSQTESSILQQAAQTSPSAYLVKPVTEQSLQAAIEMAVFQLPRPSQPSATTTTELEEDNISFNDYLFVKHQGKLVKIQPEDIILISVAKDRYCSLHTLTDTYLVRAALRDILELLPAQKFMQVHRSHIVKVAAITSFDEHDAVLEVGNQSIPWGKSYRTPILRKLKII